MRHKIVRIQYEKIEEEELVDCLTELSDYNTDLIKLRWTAFIKLCMIL